MVVRNETTVTEFILRGLTDDPGLQVPLFMLFLIFYTITILCCIGISVLIFMDSKLHKPMYFFLCNLSISDCFCSSVTTPKLLKDLLSEKKSISLVGCTVQTFFIDFFASCGGYLLSAMSYDRYAAICRPLLYHVIISRSMCVQMVTIVYLLGIITAVSFTACAFNSSFCGSNVIDHFYCDVPALMGLSCSDTLVREIVILTVAFVFGVGSMVITATSYVSIITTILKIPSGSGRIKSFSTCGSHLTSLSLFYVTGLFCYLSQPNSSSATQVKVVSVFYSILVPMLNPLIYSLRNREVKGVMHTIIHKKFY